MVVSMLAGCASSTGNGEKPTIMLSDTKKTMPAEAETPCNAPVKLPDRRIDAKETTTFWDADRDSLELCELRRAAAVATIMGTP